MKHYLMFLSLFLVFSLIFVINSEAIPTCTFRDTCNGDETCIFSVNRQNNSHVGSCDYYTTKLCCNEITSATIRTTSCNADEGGIISMYQTGNAHAGPSTYYNNVVCAKTSNNPVVVNIRTSCLARENCVASIFQTNNAHIGSCGYYSNNICIQELFNVTITIILNTTTPNWNESIGLQGVATRADSSAIDTSADPEDVEVFVNSTKICTTDTNSSGGYACNFTAPLTVGIHELNVTVDDPTTGKSHWNSTTFTVKQVFGETKAIETTAESIACYEEPRIVQNPDGTIKIATVRICVWK